MTRIVALFKNAAGMEEAVEKLKAAGIQEAYIRTVDGRKFDVTARITLNDSMGAAMTGTTGMQPGPMITSAPPEPSRGPVDATNELAGLGLSPALASEYGDELEGGKALVLVHIQDQADKVIELLRQVNPTKIATDEEEG